MCNILEIARKLGCFKVLVSVVETAGLSEALERQGPLTFFAPTDHAFAKMGRDSLEQLMHNPSQLRRVIAQHILAGKTMLEDLPKCKKLVNALGDNLKLTMDADGVFIDKAMLVEADLEADNGIIHAIDTVLLPRAA